MTDKNKEWDQLLVLALLREALGDPQGRLMQPDLIEHAKVLARDAARYRWLRDNKAYVGVQPRHANYPIGKRTGWTTRLIHGNDKNMDAAIDSEMTDLSGGIA